MKNKIQKERDKIEQEKNMLKLTLDILINENNSLKNTLNETETNVKANKDQLKDKLNSLTNKDEVLNNLNTELNQLIKKFKELKLRKKRHFSEEDNPNVNLLRKDENNNNNNKGNNNYFEFYLKQNELDNEVNDIKRHINFLNNKFKEDDDIILMKEKFCNLKNIFDNDSLNKLKKILEEKNSNNVLYLVDKNKKVWKLKKREDIPNNNFEKEENIICSNFNNLSNKYKNYNIGEFSNRPEETIDDNFLLSPEDLKKRNEKNTAVEDMMKSSFIL